jgi:hypothetical protein
MASLVLSGDTSGTVTLAAPTVAGTQAYTLPTAVPAANGYALTSTTGGVMSWASVAASPGGSNTQIQYNNGGTFAGSANMTFNGTGLVAATTIGVGGATPSTSGSGITFPAAQSASTNANTLDDYEEGTITNPLIIGGATITSGVTGTSTYTKIGRLVYSDYVINYTAGTTGNITLSLPFTSSATMQSYWVGIVFNGGWFAFSFAVNPSSAVVELYDAYDPNTAMAFTAGQQRLIKLSVVYYVD